MTASVVEEPPRALAEGVRNTIATVRVSTVAAAATAAKGFVIYREKKKLASFVEREAENSEGLKVIRHRWGFLSLKLSYAVVAMIDMTRDKPGPTLLKFM